MRTTAIRDTEVIGTVVPVRIARLTDRHDARTDGTRLRTARAAQIGTLRFSHARAGSVAAGINQTQVAQCARCLLVHTGSCTRRRAGGRADIVAFVAIDAWITLTDARYYLQEGIRISTTNFGSGRPNRETGMLAS
jgi:hypothetical protein